MAMADERTPTGLNRHDPAVPIAITPNTDQSNTEPVVGIARLIMQQQRLLLFPLPSSLCSVPCSLFPGFIMQQEPTLIGAQVDVVKAIVVLVADCAA